MNPPRAQMNAAQADRRQSVRIPRASDGVGKALRQVYSGQPTAPADMMRLLDRLTCD